MPIVGILILMSMISKSVITSEPDYHLLTQTLYYYSLCPLRSITFSKHKEHKNNSRHDHMYPVLTHPKNVPILDATDVTIRLRAKKGPAPPPP